MAVYTEHIQAFFFYYLNTQDNNYLHSIYVVCHVLINNGDNFWEMHHQVILPQWKQRVHLHKPRLQTCTACYRVGNWNTMVVIICVSKHRKGTVKIQCKKILKKMLYLCRALTMDGAFRTRSCSGWVGGEWTWRPRTLPHTNSDFINTQHLSDTN